MKKVLLWAMVLGGIMLGSCTKDDDSNDPGSIYGIVTELGTAEPMKAVGVELYKAEALLLKTVTFDDGHFEFKDLNPENYQVKVVADGYEQTEEGYVTVEAGRQARIDLQVKKTETGLVIKTTGATVNEGTVTLNGEYKYSETSPNEIGFLYATHNNPKNGGTIVKCKDKDIKGGYYSNGTFTATVNDLDGGTYYYQAYAINSKGIAYGEVRSFTINLPDYITFDNLMIQPRDLGSYDVLTAAKICKSSRVGGFSDWRLPTEVELSVLYTFKDEIGGFKEEEYWTSDERHGYNSFYGYYYDEYYFINFYNGYVNSTKNYSEKKYVRAVRTIN